MTETRDLLAELLDPAAEETTGAEFSLCLDYRYQLWRRWDPLRKTLVFVMLNPSTADDVANDPTVERCQRRATMLGYGGLEVLNCFAYRSTNPKALVQVVDPVGPDNMFWIQTARERNPGCDVVAAWGTHAKLRDQGEAVAEVLAAGGRVMCLGINRDDSPVHPLYVPYRRALRLFR